MTLGQFMYVIRKRIKLDSTEALFFFLVNNVLCNNTKTLGAKYIKHIKIKMDFYIYYIHQKNTFG